MTDEFHKQHGDSICLVRPISSIFEVSLETSFMCKYFWELDNLQKLLGSPGNPWQLIYGFASQTYRWFQKKTRKKGKGTFFRSYHNEKFVWICWSRKNNRMFALYFNFKTRFRHGCNFQKFLSWCGKKCHGRFVLQFKKIYSFIEKSLTGLRSYIKHVETSGEDLNSRKSTFDLSNLSESIPTWVVVDIRNEKKIDFRNHDNPFLIYQLKTQSVRKIGSKKSSQLP